MLDLIEFLFLGSVLGFASGISPGPLQAVTISETLQHGKWEVDEGCNVSFNYRPANCFIRTICSVASDKL